MQVQPNKAARNSFYERLITLYETANRPDLACEARLKWAEYQMEDEKWIIVAKGLGQTMQKFAADGRYVPKMVDKLKEVSEKYKGGVEFLGLQYQELLKKIPTKRGQEPNKFCIQMYEQAIAFFKSAKKDKIAKDLEGQLDLVKAGKK